ncbi:MAG: hypothetical protein JWM41_3547 [Gemmatimonadetes bacterium]|nr:hypothetical protein [Gemmatimonadota bacterium]
MTNISLLLGRALASLAATVWLTGIQLWTVDGLAARRLSPFGR